MDELCDDGSGIYLHPDGASVTIRVVDLPVVEKLMEARGSADPYTALV